MPNSIAQMQPNLFVHALENTYELRSTILYLSLALGGEIIFKCLLDMIKQVQQFFHHCEHLQRWALLSSRHNLGLKARRNRKHTKPGRPWRSSVEETLSDALTACRWGFRLMGVLVYNRSLPRPFSLRKELKNNLK